MSADGFAREALTDDGGGLAHVRHLPVVQTVVARTGGRVAADMTGRVINHWTVVGPAAPVATRRTRPGARPGARWLCRCACGTERTLLATTLQSRTPSVSCGCVGRPKPEGAPVVDDRGRRRRSGARPVTLSMRRQSKKALESGALAYPVAEFAHLARPVTRGDCLANGVNAARPCPWASCAAHLALDVNERNGNLKLNFPDREPWELPDTCTLDVADRDGATLEDTGSAMNITRERVRQIEDQAFAKLRATEPALFAALLDAIGVSAQPGPTAYVSERALSGAEPTRTLSEMVLTSRRDV